MMKFSVLNAYLFTPLTGALANKAQQTSPLLVTFCLRLLGLFLLPGASPRVILLRPFRALIFRFINQGLLR